MKRPTFLILCVGIAAATVSCSDRNEPHRGDLSKQGGSPSVRLAYNEPDDDTSTPNDESNDQPLGHFGTMTLDVTSESSGNSYTLDGELDGFSVDRLYFPRGGWIDFYACELDQDLTGECDDEEGRWWSYSGESSWSPSAVVDEQDDDASGVDSNDDDNGDEDDY